MRPCSAKRTGKVAVWVWHEDELQSAGLAVREADDRKSISTTTNESSGVDDITLYKERENQVRNHPGGSDQNSTNYGFWRTARRIDCLALKPRYSGREHELALGSASSHTRSTSPSDIVPGLRVQSRLHHRLNLSLKRDLGRYRKS